MNQMFRISKDFKLHISDGKIRVQSPDGSILVGLPEKNFIHASVSSYTTPLGNNHYHHIVQKVESAYFDPVIESVTETSEGVTLQGSLSSGAETAGYQIEFNQDSNGLIMAARINHDSINRIHLSLCSSSDERFYGFGEQFTFVEFSGKYFPLISGEQGLGRGAEPCSSIVEARSGSAGDAFTTYAPIPVMVTSEHRALYLETGRIVFMDIKHKNPSLVGMEAWDRQVRLRVWQGSSLLDAITLHTAVTGRYVPLPPWAHGVVAGLRGGKDQVEEILERCDRFKVPVSAIWIEDWVGRRGPNYGPPLWWRWTPNEEVYPDFRNWVSKLKARGIRVLTYFNPFIADDEDFIQYQEAKAGGYFVADSKGRPYRKKTGMGYGYYMVDLSNPRAFRWLKDIMLKTILEYGVSGWMADYGEYLSFDCTVAGGISGEAYHQHYALDWIRLNREVVEEAGRLGDMLVFNRCGFGDVNKYAISFWEGDQNVTWDEHDGLGSSIVGLLSGGISGIAINHSDIGGHTTLVNPLLTLIRSQELLWRWVELAVFLPVFRTHVGTLQTPNHQFYSCDESFAFFALMGRLHLCFADYFVHLEEEAAITGHPLIRHTMLHDEAAGHFDLRYQFMLGPDVVVFPVWHAGDMEVEGYLPCGNWANAWEGVPLTGGCFMTFKAPYGKPAFLLRTNSDWGQRLQKAVASFQEQESSNYHQIPTSLSGSTTGMGEGS
jgi:alpha-glucosidase